jgi:hypothetical protein
MPLLPGFNTLHWSPRPRLVPIPFFWNRHPRVFCFNLVEMASTPYIVIVFRRFILSVALRDWRIFWLANSREGGEEEDRRLLKYK